jgi:hypothetical protein
MKLEYRLFPCWPEPQFTSFHFFPLSGLQYKTTGDALRIELDKVRSEHMNAEFTM